MKCVVEEGPSCVRCLKSGRQCEFPQPGQVLTPQPRRRSRPQPHQIQEPVGHVPYSRTGEGNVALNRPLSDNQARQLNRGSLPNSYNTTSWTPITPEPSAGGPKRSSELPSLYSASPRVTVVDESSFLSNNSNVPANHQPPSKRRRTGVHVLGAGNGIGESISERDMEQLLEMYASFSQRRTR
jgi:hypothetical protein